MGYFILWCRASICDLVKCELRVEVATCIYFTSCELHLFHELRVALIVRVQGCELHLICELRVERKLRVGNSEVRVGPKLRVAYFLLKE